MFILTQQVAVKNDGLLWKYSCFRGAVAATIMPRLDWCKDSTFFPWSAYGWIQRKEHGDDVPYIVVDKKALISIY